MNAVISKIWRGAASVRLTFLCMAALCVCAGSGFFLIPGHVNVFTPLQDTPLLDWARTWGWSHLSRTWWFFAMMIFLAVLAFNTFACTTDRVAAIWRRGKSVPGIFALALKLAPHIMHYALLILLLGYLTSYLFAGTLSTVILLPGRETALENTDVTLTLTDMKIQYHDGLRMPPFEDRAVNATGVLAFSSASGRAKTAEVGVNRPVRFQGLSVHLSDFRPRSKGGMSTRTYMNLTVRRDPGIPVYYAGMLLFLAGLALFVWSITPRGAEQMRGIHA